MITVNEYIHYILMGYDELTAHRWEVFSPIKQSQGANHDIKKVNEFLRREIGLLPFDTTETRMCIVDSHYELWCVDFEEFIAPFIATHGLPCWTTLSGVCHDTP